MRGVALTLGAATAAFFAAAAAWAAAPERGVAVWDGRPSFGGAWIAHREAASRPLRVIVAAADGGETEAVLIRAGDGAIPGFTVSAALAEALDLEPGRPAPLTLTVIGGPEISSAERAPGASESAFDGPASRTERSAAQARPAGSPPAAAASDPERGGRSATPRTRAGASPVSRPTSLTDRRPGALAEARAPRPRPGTSDAPSASPPPLGRPGSEAAS